MGRGQSRPNSALKSFSLSIDRESFISIIQDWYQLFLEEERSDTHYHPGEDWAADLMRNKNFPPLNTLWEEAPKDVGRLMLDYETDFLDLVQSNTPRWKPNNYFVHRLEQYNIDPDGITMRGTCIYAPDHIKNLLNNLITNISDTENTEQIILDSLLELQKGRQYALPAIPQISILVSDPSRKVSQVAQQTLDLLKGL